MLEVEAGIKTQEWEGNRRGCEGGCSGLSSSELGMRLERPWIWRSGGRAEDLQ